jgi:RNA polymerase sigma-70 factor (ECF subfamily)
MDENSEKVSDGELVRAARDGDARAFAELVRRYRRAAYAVALSVTRHHEDAEDAAQESFLTALDRIEECRNPEKFSGWLLTIVRNRSRNLLRREKLRKSEPIPFGVATLEPGPEKQTERAELRARLRRALDELSETQREIVLLHDLEGWKHREISDRMGIPSGTVRSHLHYARKKLREILAPEVANLPEERAG